jgi:hypothetical protein
MCSAEKFSAGAGDNGPPRGVADPKFRHSVPTGGSNFEAADPGRARSAMASSRGNVPGAPLTHHHACGRAQFFLGEMQQCHAAFSSLIVEGQWLRYTSRPSVVTVAHSLPCALFLYATEQGAARPTTFGGAVGGTEGISQAKPFSGLPVGGSGAVLGDLPPITLGLPTGVANEFGR